MIDEKKKKIILKSLVISVVILIVFLTLKFFNILMIYKTGTLDHIITSGRTFEGVLLFLLLYTLRPVFGILPASPLAIAGGIMYGTLWGTIIVVIGALTSGTFGFFLARYIGKEYFDRITHHRIIKVKSRIEKGSWATVIVMNFIGLPWDFVSIASGLSKIKYKDFLLGISISSIPQSFIAVYLGNVLFNMRSIVDILKFENLIVVVVIILGITLPHYLKNKIEKRH